MTEEEARQWLHDFGVPRGTMQVLENFVDFLLAEANNQNLISTSTHEHVWSRHIVDSAQLVTLGQSAGDGSWLDLGSGAGLPGLVVAALFDKPVVLVESRRKRVDFLSAAVEKMGIANRVVVEGRRVELLSEAGTTAVISARAFAPLDRLFALAYRFSHPDTLWVLPKGQSAQSELEATRGTWQGVFHVEQSVTDPAAAIIVARNVQRVKQ